MGFLQETTPEGYVSTGAYVGIFFEGIVMIVYAILLIKLYRIYRVSKLKLTLHLLIGFTFFMCSTFFSWIAKWWLWHHIVYALEGPYWLQIIYTFKVSMACMVIGNYFILKFYRIIFSKEVSSQSDMLLIAYKILAVIIILIIHIPAYLENSNELRELGDSIVFLLVCIDSIYTVPYCIKCFKAARSEVFGKKYKSIGITAVNILNVMIMFFFDRLLIIMGVPGPYGEVGWSVFYYAGFISAICGLTLAIYGFVLK
ncbi:MAG: hypothetical protein ACFFAN_00690 [Promethearchaeota archaeon]